MSNSSKCVGAALFRTYTFHKNHSFGVLKRKQKWPGHLYDGDRVKGPLALMD